MGQPTSGVAQRAGHTQLWQHVPVLAAAERGFGEHQFRLLLGARLSLLFFQSLLLIGQAHAWFRSTGRLQTYNQLRWERYWKLFPNVRAPLVIQRYFNIKIPKFLLFDGELTYLTLAFRHRKLRLGSIFWARPRFFRINGHLALSLRGYNVTAPRPRRLRARWRRTQQGLP